MNKNVITTICEIIEEKNSFEQTVKENTMIVYEDKNGFIQVDYIVGMLGDKSYSVIGKYCSQGVIIPTFRKDYILNAKDVYKELRKFIKKIA